jgi:hypothetical protein
MNWQGPANAKRGKAPAAEPFLWDSRDVMTVLGIGRTKLWELDREGLLGPKVYIGRNPKWQTANVQAYALKGDAA